MYNLFIIFTVTNNYVIIIINFYKLIIDDHNMRIIEKKIHNFIHFDKFELDSLDYKMIVILSILHICC